MKSLTGEVRADFPMLGSAINGKPLIYLDNAATTQLPESVIYAIAEYYRSFHANVHRGIYTLSELNTERLEEVRRLVRDFIGARASDEIIFTSGATQSINLVARAMANGIFCPGDEVICTAMEHHSNYLPWREACRRTGATLKTAPVNGFGGLELETLRGMIGKKTRLVAATCVSNVTGVENPVEIIAEMAHGAGAWVLLDGAQVMRHRRVDVAAMDCDFFCFSAHKMMGPTGTGVLYAKKEILEELQPESFGGGMAADVGSGKKTEWEDIPLRFEAGTPNIAGIVGLGAAIGYLSGLSISRISAREAELMDYLKGNLKRLMPVRLIGPPGHNVGAVSFNISGTHCYDAAKLFDQMGIAVRSGSHCARPLLNSLGLDGALRASPAFYNTSGEIDAFLSAIEKIAVLTGRGAI